MSVTSALSFQLSAFSTGGYWAMGFALGFRLWNKVPQWLRRVWFISLVPLGLLTVVMGAGHGCGGLHGARMVDTASNWRPLPPLVYIQPDAKGIAPTPALPPVSENTEKWASTVSPSFTTSSSTTSVTTTSGTVWSMQWSGGTSTILSSGGGSVTTGQVMIMGTATTGAVMTMGGSSIAYEHMANMKSYPASERPSECVASCLSHHRSWVTPVENSYCEKDTSNDDGGFYGWVKEGSALIPTVWPPTNQSTERAPELIHLKPDEQISLTEGKRSY